MTYSLFYAVHSKVGKMDLQPKIHFTSSSLVSRILLACAVIPHAASPPYSCYRPPRCASSLLVPPSPVLHCSTPPPLSHQRGPPPHSHRRPPRHVSTLLTPPPLRCDTALEPPPPSHRHASASCMPPALPCLRLTSLHETFRSLLRLLYFLSVMKVKQKIGHTLKHRWKGDTSPTMSRHSLEHGNPLEIVSALLICIHDTPLSALDLDRTSQILFHYA
jgi:hypothetical protein